MTPPRSGSIIPGIHLDERGQASVDAPMGQHLINLALELEAYTPHPVDVQHVLAAIILAVDQGELAAGQPLPKSDQALCQLLARQVNRLFERHGGRVSREEPD